MSEFTYGKNKIIISILVVLKETLNNDNLILSSGFFTMYTGICGKSDKDISNIIQEQREKAFNEDWSNLIIEIQSKINTVNR